MLTVISQTRVKMGQGAAWDAAYHERAADARMQPGWIDLHLLVPVDDPQNRVVVGTWRDRDAWQRWHDTDVFTRTRERLNAATESGGEHQWYDVVEDRVATA
jgi:heme-degrading monooxygenase HmoA